MVEKSLLRRKIFPTSEHPGEWKRFEKIPQTQIFFHLSAEDHLDLINICGRLILDGCQVPTKVLYQCFPQLDKEEEI